VRGEDLKKLRLKPFVLYSKVLEKVLYLKIDKKLRTKQQELTTAKAVFLRLAKTVNK
jgi:hypothetical protein